MEEKVKEMVEMKQRSLAEDNQKTLEALKERYIIIISLAKHFKWIVDTPTNI
jgi:homeobox protein cut-like